MPVALISASTRGSIMPGNGDGATVAISSGKPSHWSVLKTVKRFRNGTACASSPVSAARFFLIIGNEAIGIDDRRATLALANVAAERQCLAEG